MNTCKSFARSIDPIHDYQRAQVESTQPGPFTGGSTIQLRCVSRNQAVNNTSETSYTWYLNELEIDPSNYDTSKQFKFVSNHEILMIPMLPRRTMETIVVP
uniref:Ig-like domain-containing protein n=1 Tax=Ditylenchus dipsaci TaxID=166011 RepID=A0A915EE23_9BILA